jgi:hypothetical protein
MLKKFRARASAIAGVVLTSIALPAAADGGPDLSALTSSISFASVVTAILAVAALLATVYLAIKGARIVLAFLRG